MKPDSQKRERTAIVVFSLDPRQENKSLGLSKPENCRLHGALRRRTLALVESLTMPDALDPQVTPILVSDLVDPEFTGLTVSQRGSGFGSRFLNALTDVAALGFDRIVVVGTDTAALGAQDLQRAISTSGDDVLVGPSQDGGFYLLSLQVSDLGRLRNLPWRSSQLLTHLRERFLARTVRELSCRRDLDCRSDFVRLLPLLRRIVREQLGVERIRVRSQRVFLQTSFPSLRPYDPRRAPPLS